MFQQLMERVLHDLPQVICYQDDILVTGRNDQEHLETLEQVLQRIEQAGLKLECCLISSRTHRVFGIFDRFAWFDDPDQSRGPLKAPTPQNVKQLKNHFWESLIIMESSSQILHISHTLCKTYCVRELSGIGRESASLPLLP